VDDTTKVEEFAKAFFDLGWEIISTKETCAILSKAKIPTVSIEEYTGVSEDYGIPPTLHAKVEAALTKEDTDWRIDIVFDIPYPLSKGNDVGGLTLLALAAKANRVPVMTNADIKRVIDELKESSDVSKDLRSELITKANAFIADHYIELLQLIEDAGDGRVGIKVMELLNGENPYQKPCHLFAIPDDKDPLSIQRFELLKGEAPCFTNIADLDSIVHTLCLAYTAFLKKFGKSPYIGLAAKHGNTCGFACDWQNPGVVLEKALFGNPKAIWGGEVILNFDVTDELCELLYKSDKREKKLGDASWMLDVVAAPSFSQKAVAILGRRKERKLLKNPALKEPLLFKGPWDIRPVRGGFLRQPPSNYVLDFNNAELVGRDFSDNDYSTIILAWATAWSSSLGGNEVALAKELQLIGSGGGPATSIACCNAVECAKKQGHLTKGSIFAADAFFPYIDGPEILANAGCSLGLVPKGGKREEEVRKFFQEKNIKVCFLPEEFRGFCRH